MNPSIRTPRTVTLAWQQYLPFNLANVQAYAPVKAGVADALPHLVETVAEFEIAPAVGGGYGVVHLDVELPEFQDVTSESQP